MFKRINWGTAVVLSFIAFGTFIGVLVFKIQTDQRYEHSLVIEDYYKQEQNLSKTPSPSKWGTLEKMPHY